METETMNDISDASETGIEGEETVDGDTGRRRGTWKHAAFHVATTIATPAAYAPLPFALASLGWPLGVISLVTATLATWYSSILIASLWRWNGKKQTTYPLLAQTIFGHWGYWSITFFQQVASLANNIAIQIAAGSSLKAIYKHCYSHGTLNLQHFIIFFGAFELVLSQLPDIHSLRWVNAVCTFSTIGFAGTTIGVTIYNGKKMDRKSVNYDVNGSSYSKAFKAFNALGAIAFSFGDAMLPEIQSTVKETAKKNMYKGVTAAYVLIVLTYWQLAFFGYWAFGSGVQPYIVASLTTPQWTVLMANVFAVIQITGCYQTNICPFRGTKHDQQDYLSIPLQALPGPFYIYIGLHYNDYSCCCGDPFFRRFCVYLWGGRVHTSRFRVPSFSISESRKTAQKSTASPSNQDSEHRNSRLVLSCCSTWLHWCSQAYYTRY